MLRDPNCPDQLDQEGTTVLLSSFEPLAAPARESRLLNSTKQEPLPASGALPTFYALLQPMRKGEHASSVAGITEGSRLGDFELLHELGRGSLARVFLARQVSLGRHVALKVSACHGGEARTLASLEHDHIVRVFCQAVDRERDLRLLCMQYVPGTTLEQVIRHLGQRAPCTWSGREILESVAAPSSQTTPDSMPPCDGQILLGFDLVEAVCWLGARLAEALAYAHSRGVLHRDIKPANILLTRHGRPLLSDFNLAFDPRQAESGGADLFGGTLRYMAPEHLAAFNRDIPLAAVDERSDLYSLGVVLFELLTGTQPFQDVCEELPLGETLRTLAAGRRSGAPSPRLLNPDVPEVLDRVLRRCLEPEPARRYQTAAELAQVLEGCQELRRVAKNMPRPGPVTQASRRFPQLMAVLLPLLPHLLGALVVFLYTGLWVASHPDREELEKVFMHLGLGYSVVIFPLTGGLTYWILRPIWRTLVQLRSPGDFDAVQVTAMRHRALNKPFWGVFLSTLGWLPGAVLLPLFMLYLVPASASWDVFLHYALSFTLAGLIALTYTEFADQFLLLCVAYPCLWVDPQRPQQTARAELGPVHRRLGVFQILSVLIPLAAGIALMAGLIGADPERRATSSYQTFLLLVTVLMVLGMAGSWLAVLISSRLSQTLAALTGGRG